MPFIKSTENSPQSIPLSDLVVLRPRYLRSVNLEHDFYAEAPLDGYIPTTGALATLERIVGGVGQASERAWSVTGPYGTGKSAFALMLTKVLAPPPAGDSDLRRRISKREPLLASRLFQSEAEGFWPMLVTGGREPLVQALLRGLTQISTMLPEGVLLLPSDEAQLSERGLSLLYEDASKSLQEHVSGCRGLLVVVDELGKFLEFAALHPERGDVQPLQELAELAVRSTAHPVLLVTVLHQAFDEYAHRLSRTQQQEWRKVQGRFSDIPFGDAPEETVSLVSEAIVHHPNTFADAWLAPTLQTRQDRCRDLQLTPKSLTGTEFAEILRDAYPLHPVTLLALPQIFRRFGQSERSLFSFLASSEPHGFSEFVSNQQLTPDQVPTLTVADLYDYVTATLGTSLYSHAQAGKLWSETQEALARCWNRPPLHTRLVKTIGLLHLLGESARLSPSKELLRFACDDVAEGEIDSALAELQSATLITYRHYKKAYRPYEGSDIDIDARVRETRAEIASQADAVTTASRIQAAQPIVARRHSYETGTLRFFEVRACRSETLQDALAAPSEGDGLVLLCLTPDPVGIGSQFLSRFVGRPDIVLCIARETDVLRDAALAVETLLRVKEETPELFLDKVAQREVHERLLEATAIFHAEWSDLIRSTEPGHAGTDIPDRIWLWQGERQMLEGLSTLQMLLSLACDVAYPNTPRLRNELINRRQLSSTAASARRELIEAMLTHRHEPRLGIEGWPPEASMYVSVLEETGIHRSANPFKYDMTEVDVTYGFFSPRDENSALYRVWQEIERYLFAGAFEARPLIELQRHLTSRPYGLADGIIPVLLCAVLLHHENEVLVYEEKRFVTNLDAATFERMMKRPEDYVFQGTKIAGERYAVIERFARGILSKSEKPTLVNVVRALFRTFGHLPEYTLKTRTLDPHARALRDLFKDAREPQQLLFVDLPILFDCRPFAADETDTANVATFFSHWNVAMQGVTLAYEALLIRLEDTLKVFFSVGDWEELRARAAAIGGYISEPRLTAFLQRAADESLSRDKWLESVAAVVVGRPPVSWSDAEENRFAPMVQPLAAAFAHSELLVFEKNRISNIVHEERIGLRLAITRDTGEEDASMIVMSKQQDGEIHSLVEKALQRFDAIMAEYPHEVRLAVIGEVARKIMQEKYNG